MKGAPGAMRITKASHGGDFSQGTNNHFGVTSCMDKPALLVIVEYQPLQLIIIDP